MDLTFLVIHNTSVLRYLTIKIAKASGFEKATFIEAENAQTAIQALYREPPTLILSENDFPEMAGEKILKALSQKNLLPRVPIILISSVPPPDLIDQFKGAEHIGYIKKPFQPEELRKEIIRVLGDRIDGNNAIASNAEGLDF